MTAKRQHRPAANPRTSDAAETALRQARERIDDIDHQLRSLLNQRAACAKQIARAKASAGTDETPVFYRPEREAQILARLRAENEGPLPDDHIERLFREIISCCLSLEQPLTIACLGPTGTYTEAAAIRQFGHFAKIRALPSVADVFREVESGAVHYGVVAVENSTDGMVKHTLDCLADSPLRVCAEVELPIHHALLVRSGANPATLTEVFAHEQSLAQCRHWLDMHHPALSRTPVASNAEAARIVAERDNVAAIAGEPAADRYGLEVLADRIEDHPGNKTRFFVIGDQQVRPSGRDRTSLLVCAHNEPGALYQVLEPFHRHGISLSRIESRPSKATSWQYIFFIDFEGHSDDPNIGKVLEELERRASSVKNLGSYPRGASA